MPTSPAQADSKPSSPTATSRALTTGSMETHQSVPLRGQPCITPPSSANKKQNAPLSAGPQHAAKATQFMYSALMMFM